MTYYVTSKHMRNNNHDNPFNLTCQILVVTKNDDYSTIVNKSSMINFVQFPITVSLEWCVYASKFYIYSKL